METLTGKPRILLVEDEPEMARISQGYLREAGYVVRHAATGADALRIFEAEPLQLVVLDIGLPDMSGFEIARRIRTGRKYSNVPIIMLTALDDEKDKVRGLEIGADDYVTKPFSAPELVARIGAMLRRAHARKPDVQTLTWGNRDQLKLDSVTRQATLDGKPVALAPKEFDLLWGIMEAKGAVLDRDTILREIWHFPFYTDTRTIDVHVRQLRKKLGDNSPIDTVWGQGYRLRQDKS
jgi:two-component system alkaline phosphatase synthesis response regulator PhoP